MNSFERSIAQLEATQEIPDRLEAQRRQLALRHKLAMEAIGAIRVALAIHRPFFDALLDAEKASVDAGLENPNPFREIMHNESFGLQCRMASLSVQFLSDLDAVADEVHHRLMKKAG